MDGFFLILDFIKLKVEINYIYTLLIFFTYLFLHSSLSLPGGIIFFTASGYFFGLFIGFLVSIFSLVFGSLFFFVFFSSLIKKIFPLRYKKYSKKINNFIADSSFEYLILLRILPGPPLIFQNLLLSMLNIKKKLFCLTAFIGYFPIVFISAFIGNQLNNFNSLKLITFSDLISLEFIFFIIIIFVLICLKILYKKN